MNSKGITYVSLVGFEFNRTRVLGFAVTVSSGLRRGEPSLLCQGGHPNEAWYSIRELVPKRAVAAIARWAFQENY